MSTAKLINPFVKSKTRFELDLIELHYKQDIFHETITAHVCYALMELCRFSEKFPELFYLFSSKTFKMGDGWFKHEEKRLSLSVIF